MSHDAGNDVQEYLKSGRRLLEEAPEQYGRALSPEEYWWLGVGLAASTLAELGGKPFALGRLDQLMERFGHKGSGGDWLQRFVEELSGLNAEGLLWPVYRRSPEGPVERTDLVVHGAFAGESAYFLALAHIAVAIAVHREEPHLVKSLAGVILDILESGSARGQEDTILQALKPREAGS